jgi:hypothetical protein
MRNRPTWYTNDTDSAWDRVKGAFANDWEQTRHDFGSKSARDLNQDVDDTAKQAMGSPDAFENHEQAFRFGYAANRHYRAQYPTWNSDLESRLRQDYGSEFDRDRDDIRRAYEYRWGTTGTGMRDEARP